MFQAEAHQHKMEGTSEDDYKNQRQLGGRKIGPPSRQRHISAGAQLSAAGSGCSASRLVFVCVCSGVKGGAAGAS